MARTHTEHAIRVIVAMMRDPMQPGTVRLGCANSLMDRGWGKAKPKDDDDETTDKATFRITIRHLFGDDAKTINGESKEVLLVNGNGHDKEND